MKEYLLVAKVIEPINFREAISKVAKSLALIDSYEAAQQPKPAPKETKPLREQIAKRLEEEKRLKSKQTKPTVVKSPQTREETALKQNIKHGSMKLYQTMTIRSGS